MRGMFRPATRAIAALAVCVPLGLTACGEDSVAPQRAAPVRASASATAFQNQVIRVVDSASATVVQIQCGRSLGSGVVFDRSGDVVTNAHVVDGERRCMVRLSDGEEHPARTIGSNSGNDLAVVHLSGATPEPAAFGDSSKLKVGQTVLAMGNPLGLRSSVTQGIVSSLDRNVAESASVELSSLIQTSAEINPGNSGGALVDLSGRVIGIPTLTALDPEFGDAQAPGIGFAIPSNAVRSVAAQLIASG